MKFPDDFIGKVICGDCLEVMREIPDDSIDLLFADPPFNSGGRIGTLNKSYLQDANDKLSEEDYQKFVSLWFAAARRIAKRLLVTCGVSHIWRYPSYLWCIVISKPSSPSFNRFGGFNCWEPLLVYDKPVKRITRDLVEYDSKNLKNDGLSKHPCPDSIEMVRWIIDTWTKPDEIVLDPFLGSGTTVVAAKQLKRRWVGIDIISDYCAMAIDRLRQEEMGL